ncbi:MAG: pentapeptide repeat-containing protein, partial [Micromonosporaceae bacterium]
MADFIEEDLSGSRFERVKLTGSRLLRVDLNGAEFRSADLADAQLRDVDLRNVVMRGVYVNNVDIYGELGTLTVNGVEVSGFVNAELDRRHPERAKMRPTDPAGFREAWDVVERLWGGTVERARGLDPELLHESVDAEWSFIQTLRHLVFAT